MTYKIGIDAGHGGNGSTRGKRTPDGEYEWNFNDVVVRAFISEMNTYNDVQVKRFDDATGKKDVPLITRTNGANNWGSDLYLSFHHNADKGKWASHTGVETHVYETKPSESVKLAKLVQAALVESYGLRDRGIKYTNLHITREVKCPAVLVEGGYMDSKIDIGKLRNNSVLMKAGKLIAQAVAKYAGLKKKVVIVAPITKVDSVFYEPSSTEFKRVKILSSVWSQKDAFFSENGRVKILEKDSIFKFYGEKDGYFNLGGGEWVNSKYAELIQQVGEITIDIWSQKEAKFNENGRVKILKKGAHYKIYREFNGYYNVGGNEWVNKKYMKLVN